MANMLLTIKVGTLTEYKEMVWPYSRAVSHGNVAGTFGNVGEKSADTFRRPATKITYNALV